FILISWACRCPSQVQTEGSGPTVEKVSASLTLTCHISGVCTTNISYTWGWIHQTPDRDLQHITLQYPFMGLQHIASSFQTRVSISADPSRNQLSLEVLLPSAADQQCSHC
ncbi:HVD34 protein, partial [Zapornia atra]|nr:HVD34 protein [Zapornia atra]